MSPVLRIQQKTKYLPFGGLHLGRWGQVVKNSPASAGDTRDARFHPWVRKIPWRRKRQPAPVFLPGKSQGQRSLVGYSPKSCKESDMTKQLSIHIHVQEGSGERGNKTTAGCKIIVQRRDRPQTNGINRHQNGAKGSSHVKQGCQGKRCGCRLSEQSPEELKDQPCISL